MKSVKTAKSKAARQQKEHRHRQPEMPAITGWSLPGGRALAEFAFQSGFLVPVLMGVSSQRNGHAGPPSDSPARAGSLGFPSI